MCIDLLLVLGYWWVFEDVMKENGCFWVVFKFYKCKIVIYFKV